MKKLIYILLLCLCFSCATPKQQKNTSIGLISAGGAAFVVGGTGIVANELKNNDNQHKTEITATMLSTLLIGALIYSIGIYSLMKPNQ